MPARAVLLPGPSALVAILFFLMACLVDAAGATSPADSVPMPLRAWIPWALHGHEELACPTPFDKPGQHDCAFPGRLALDLTAHGGTFALSVVIHGTRAIAVALPGDEQIWPAAV